MSYGFASHIGIGKETAWATPVAATEYFEAMSENLVENRARFDTRNIVGGFFEPDDSAGLKTYNGDIVLTANAANIGHFLNGVFGQNSVTVILSGALFTNQFLPRQSDVSSEHPLPSYTIEVYRAGTLVDSSFEFAGVNFTTMTLNVAPNQDLRCTFGAIPKTRAFIAKTVPSFPGSPVDPFLFDACSVQFPGGTAYARIEALTVTLENQLEGVPTLNATDEIAKIRRTGPPMVSITGTIDFTDLTEFNDFVAQTERRLVATFTRADSFQLVIDLPRVVFTEVPVAIAGRERITTDFSMKGRYHSGSATAIDVTLTTINTF